MRSGCIEVVHPAGVGDRETAPHHQRQVLQRIDVPEPEHLVQRAVGRVVELRVAVGAPVDRVDPPADRLAAVLLGRHREGPQAEVDQLVGGRPGGRRATGPRLRGRGRRRAVCSRDFTRLKTDVDGCMRELRADRGADPLQPGQDRHLQRARAHAVAEGLQVIAAGHLEDLGLTATGQSDAGDVVDRELGPGRRQVDAGPVVEQPDVVAATRPGTRSGSARWLTRGTSATTCRTRWP